MSRQDAVTAWNLRHAAAPAGSAFLPCPLCASACVEPRTYLRRRALLDGVQCGDCLLWLVPGYLDGLARDTGALVAAWNTRLAPGDLVTAATLPHRAIENTLRFTWGDLSGPF